MLKDNQKRSTVDNSAFRYSGHAGGPMLIQCWDEEEEKEMEWVRKEGERERIGLVLFSKNGWGMSDRWVEILFRFLNSSRSFQSYCLFKVRSPPVWVYLFFCVFLFFLLPFLVTFFFGFIFLRGKREKKKREDKIKVIYSAFEIMRLTRWFYGKVSRTNTKKKKEMWPTFRACGGGVGGKSGPGEALR